MQPSLFKRLAAVTRANDWLQSFVPFVLGCVYLWLWWFRLPFNTTTFLLFVLSLFTTLGFASLGYFINEFFDKESDSKSGKVNRLALLKPIWQLSLFFLSLAVTLLPWIWLPSTATSWILITLQLLLFLVYSLPFPRLKDSAYASLVVDSLYAYVVPLFLSFYTFSLIAGQPGFPMWFLLFVIALFFIGLRNILIHQTSDVQKDYRSGIQTLPIKWGVAKTQITLLLLLAYELFFISLWIFVLGTERWLTIILLPVYLFAAFQSYSYIRKHAECRNSLPLDKVYQYIYPLAVLVFASLEEPSWSLLLPLHVALFVPYYFLLKKVVQFSKWVYYACVRVFYFIRDFIFDSLKALVNYSLFYFFRCFGVDLRAERKSAFQYLSEKFTTKK